MATKELEKSIRRKENKKLEIGVASLKNLKTSARKARVLADLVRGRLLTEAHSVLSFQTKAAALPMARLLHSAGANAVGRGFDLDRLIVAEIQVHKGLILKRFMPRAQGKATPIRKQSLHMDIRLSVRGDQ